MILESVGTEQWHAFYEKSDTVSFFQSPFWAEIWARYTGGTYRPAPLVAVFSSGKQVLLPLTRQRIRGGIGSVWHAAPAGTYGGWLTGDMQQLSRLETVTLLDQLIRQCGSLTMRLFPFSMDEDALSGISDPENLRPGTDVKSDHTLVMDCSAGIDAIQSRWAEGSGSMKRKIQKAERAGIRVRPAKDREDIRAYYQLYQNNVHHWDPPPSHIYRPDFFEILSGYHPHCEIWLAERCHQVLAGATILHGKNHTVYWHGVSDPSARELRPVNLLMAELINQTCHRGFRWFDFNPSMGLKGVEKFKKSFKTESFATPLIDRSTGFIQLIRYLTGLVQRQARGIKAE